MSSEKVSLMAVHPFVQKFVLAILRNVGAKSLVVDEKYVIHTDLVPKVSKRIVHAPFNERAKKIMRRNFVVASPRVPIRNVMHVPPEGVIHNRKENFVVALPKVARDVGLNQGYGKITLLLDDVSVSTIECYGAGKPLIVIRAGQKQMTKIVLSADEIKNILEKISDNVHIPLLEGVFRAAVDNFSINAVVSDIIGSRFVIKKQNAYALLER